MDRRAARAVLDGSGSGARRGVPGDSMEGSRWGGWLTMVHGGAIHV